MAFVLVADDEPGMLDTLCDVVTELGHDCLRARDGDEAFELARRERPALIVSDFMMPGRTGVELIRSLRVDPALAHIPVVLVSAAQPRGADEAWRFLPKPLQLSALEQAIAEGMTAVGFTRVPRSVSAPTNVSPLTLVREDMLNWVAHEIKSPLAAAVVTMQLMKRDVERGQPPKALGRRIATIGRQLQQMDELVNSILDAARLDEGRLDLDRAVVDLVEVVESLVEPWRELHPDVEVELEVPGPNPVVSVDRQRFRQIVDNFLSNAFKYGVPPKRIVVRVAADGDEATVTVRDFGRGIPAAELPHVFDRFHRVEGMGGRGHGLGLYICAALARLHDGRVAVSSTEGEGAAFTVALPLAGRDGRRASAA